MGTSKFDKKQVEIDKQIAELIKTCIGFNLYNIQENRLLTINSNEQGNIANRQGNVANSEGDS